MFKGLLFLGVLVALTGCHNYSANVGETLGCTLAGNGCDDGRTGEQGLTGQPGANGASCSVQTVEAGGVAPNGGARISCTDGSDALILNGTNGIDGEDGSDAPATPYTIVNIIKPCPTVGGSSPEVLLVLANRTLLASVSQSASGNNTRLALVSTGNFVTTDGRACAFSVSSTAVSWSGGSASY